MFFKITHYPAKKQVNGEPIRVLHILSGDLWGGSEAQMLLQCSALRAAGVDVQAIFFNALETERRYRNAGIPTHVAEEKAGLRACIREALRVIRQLRPAIIVTHGYKEAFAGAAARFSQKIPLVTTFHGATELLRGFRGWKLAFFLAAHKFIARRIAARIVTVTHPLAAQLGFDQLRTLVVVSNVVSPGTASPIPAPEKRSIICAGRLMPVKRFDRAIQIAARVPGAHLYIAGDGPERAALEQVAASSGASSRVHFLGFCESGQKIIAGGAVFLLSSDSEGLPTVLLEAIASRRPVVASDLPGVREVLEHFPGYPYALIRPEDVEGFAAALSKFLDTPPNIDSALIAPLSRYLPEASAQRNIEMYRQILTDKAP